MQSVDITSNHSENSGTVTKSSTDIILDNYIDEEKLFTRYQEESKYFKQTTEEVIESFERATNKLDSFLEGTLAREKYIKPKFKLNEMLVNASVLIKHNEFNMAASLLREILNQDSYHAEALIKLISTLITKGNQSEAIKACEHLVTIDYRFETVALLGDLYYRAGRDSSAQEKYLEAIPLIIKETHALFELYKNLGNILVKTGDFDSAEEYYNKAYTVNPYSDVLFVNYGTLEIQKADFELAKSHFKKALELNPKNDKAWVGLAMVHQKFSDSELAWANIENAIEINPENKTAVQILANWAVQERKYDRAIEALQVYLARVDLDEDVSMILIHIFCLKNELRFALIEVQRVLLWNPKSEQGQKVMVELKNLINKE